MKEPHCRDALQEALKACRKGWLAIGFFSFFVNLLTLTGPLYMLKIQGRTQKVTGEAGTDGWTNVEFGDGTGFQMQPEDGVTTFDVLTQVISGGDLLLLGPDATYDSEVLSMLLGDSAPPAAPGPQGELIAGSSGHAKLEGGSGDDLLHGFEGIDRISGGHGNDIIVGGSGAVDILNGDAGADIFAFRNELANGDREIDIIKDYETWQGAINLGGYQIAKYIETSHATLLWAGPDEDLIQVKGVSDLDRIAFLDDGGQQIDAPVSRPDFVPEHDLLA